MAEQRLKLLYVKDLEAALAEELRHSETVVQIRLYQGLLSEQVEKYLKV